MKWQKKKCRHGVISKMVQNDDMIVLTEIVYA